MSSWVKLATPFTREWVGKGIALFLAFALGYVVARLVTVAAFWPGFLVVDIAGLIALAVVTAVGVWWAFGTEHVHTRLRFGRAEPLAATLLVLGLAVGTFAGLTTLLHEHGQLELHGRRVARDSILGVAADFYIWHLLNSVPLLDIPQTIRWAKPYEYSDSLSGWLLLAFKAFVILPLIQAVRLVLAGPPKSYEQSVLKALLQVLPNARVVVETGRNGYAGALLQYHQVLVVVHVMRNLRNEDAATRALDRVLAESKVKLHGYLLVVDAVADRARDRIDDAFAHAPLPALLAVWRSDQPVGDLAETVKPLTMELQRYVKTEPLDLEGLLERERPDSNPQPPA